MRLHLLQHAGFEGPGLIADWAEAHSIILYIRHLYRGDAVPDPDEVQGLIVMGGPMNANEDSRFPFLTAEKALIRALLAAERPVLGICLGAQLLASALGARVYQQAEPEIGWFSVRQPNASPLPPMLAKLPSVSLAFHWHGDTFDLPAGATNWMSSEACQHQLFTLGERALGVQYHPEVDADAIDLFVEHGGAALATPSTYVQSAETIRGYAGQNKLPTWFQHALYELFLSRTLA